MVSKSNSHSNYWLKFFRNRLNGVLSSERARRRKQWKWRRSCWKSRKTWRYRWVVNVYKMSEERSEHQTHAQTWSGSWCIAHFVVIFNHIIQRYVLLFCCCRLNRNIIYCLFYSLLFGPMMLMRCYCWLLLFAAATVQCAKCLSINGKMMRWLGNFRLRTQRSRALEWCDGGVSARHINVCTLHASKQSEIHGHIVLASAKLQAHPTTSE